MSGALCLFGEVLFDEFPDGRRVLGGAPFNVAWHLAAFGESPLLISRVGKDADGDAVRSAMADWGMDLSGIQRDTDLPTGKVNVQWEQGEPHYEIVYPSAWDAIEPPCQAPESGLVYHGSLACRDRRSRAALSRLLERGRHLRFVDVNVRPPWWNREAMLEGLRGAEWVKLNNDELTELTGPGDANGRARRLMSDYALGHVLLTQGEQGARLFEVDGPCTAARPADATVVDTVGAGDALASVMILGILRGWPLDLSLQRAQSFAAAVVGIRGATTRERSFYSPLLEQWA